MLLSLAEVEVNGLTLGGRIKKIRKNADLTQQDFGARIGIKANSVSLIESGNRNASEQVILLICREFNVKEDWLRTGRGEMTVARNDTNELSVVVERLITGESSDFKRRLVNALSTLKDEHWVLLEEKLKEIVGTRDVAPADTRPRSEKPVKDWTDEDIEADVAEYRRHLLDEKEQAVRSSVLQSSSNSEVKLA